MATIPLTALGAAPAAGFEQPFEMLAACHERVVRMLALLARLRDHVRTHGADTQARQAAQDVMRYFDRAAPEHHRDEERHLFPALLARGDAEVRALVERLRQDHVRMEAGWAAARSLLAGIAEGRIERLSTAEDAVLGDFASVVDGHLEAEDGIAYPAAREVLDATALDRMSIDMMRRRGLA
jgi:hemerythrin-like domain-containing protein